MPLRQELKHSSDELFFPPHAWGKKKKSPTNPRSFFPPKKKTLLGMQISPRPILEDDDEESVDDDEFEEAAGVVEERGEDVGTIEKIEKLFSQVADNALFQARKQLGRGRNESGQPLEDHRSETMRFGKREGGGFFVLECMQGGASRREKKGGDSSPS